MGCAQPNGRGTSVRFSRRAPRMSTNDVTREEIEATKRKRSELMAVLRSLPISNTEWKSYLKFFQLPPEGSEHSAHHSADGYLVSAAELEVDATEEDGSALPFIAVIRHRPAL